MLYLAYWMPLKSLELLMECKTKSAEVIAVFKPRVWLRNILALTLTKCLSNQYDILFWLEMHSYKPDWTWLTWLCHQACSSQFVGLLSHGLLGLGHGLPVACSHNTAALCMCLLPQN